MNNIKQLLIERELKPGDRLPTEFELSEEMNVSRSSVREAMKILSANGLVDIRVGNGTYICDTPGNTMIDSFLFSFFITNPNIDDMYEFRQTIEVDVLQLILKHRDKNIETCRQMEKNLEQMRQLVEQKADSQAILSNDMEFHHLMGKASCNILMERVYNFTMDFMKPSIEKTYKTQNGEYVYKSHKKIMDVIKNNDFIRIDEAITASINTWSELQPNPDDE